MSRPAAAPRAPRSTTQATELLEQLASVDGEIATAEHNREAAIAATNAVADTIVTPLLDRRQQLLAVLEPWWAKAGAELTAGKRKSVVLGGCTIGTKAGRAKLVHGFPDDDGAVEALLPLRWAKRCIKVRYALDRTATTAALEGKHGAKLAELGFRKEQGEVFYAERLKQAGTVAGVAG